MDNLPGFAELARRAAMEELCLPARAEIQRAAATGSQHPGGMIISSRPLIGAGALAQPQGRPRRLQGDKTLRRRALIKTTSRAWHAVTRWKMRRADSAPALDTPQDLLADRLRGPRNLRPIAPVKRSGGSRSRAAPDQDDPSSRPRRRNLEDIAVRSRSSDSGPIVGGAVDESVRAPARAQAARMPRKPYERL